ncbi:MAG: YfhO family protein [Gammaproteobacteria bacterium]|nr:YfhO family protein [Gammaproteobacteria bacterium]
METLSNFILVFAIIWLVWRIMALRKEIGTGKPIIPSFVAFLLLFAIFILITVVFQLSPFHLLWLLVLSFMLSFRLMIFPFVQKITMSFIILLAMSKKENYEGKEVPAAKPPTEKSKRKRKNRRRRR